MKDISTRWSVNETLLQSYRSIFITAQSIFLAIGVFSFDLSNTFLLLLGITSMIVIWYIWFPVVKSRQLAIDYYKYASRLSKSDLRKLEEVCPSDLDYIRDRSKRKLADKIYHNPGNWRETRIKIDLILPILFTAVWIGLALMKIIK